MKETIAKALYKVTGLDFRKRGGSRIDCIFALQTQVGTQCLYSERPCYSESGRLSPCYGESGRLCGYMKDAVGNFETMLSNHRTLSNAGCRFFIRNQKWSLDLMQGVVRQYGGEE